MPRVAVIAALAIGALALPGCGSANGCDEHHPLACEHQRASEEQAIFAKNVKREQANLEDCEQKAWFEREQSEQAEHPVAAEQLVKDAKERGCK